MASALLSRLMGAVDYYFVNLHKEKFFADGWGDKAYANDQTLSRIVEENGSTDFADIESFSYEDGSSERDRIRIATFPSRCAEFLPKESRIGYAMIVSPPLGVEVRGVLVQIGGTGEEGFKLRRDAVAEPLAKKGFVSIILQNRLYGRRRPEGQKAFYIRTVGAFLMQVPATVVEAAKLAKFARITYPGVPIGLTGTSLGGTMALGAFPFFVRELAVIDGEVGNKTPVTVCSFLPPSRTDAIFRSIMFPMFDIDALVKDEEGLRSKDEAKERLFRVFEPRTVAQFYGVLQDQQQQPQTALTCIRALHDHYVPPEETQDAFETANPYFAEGRLEDVSGGHCTNIIWTSKVLPDAILETFDRLERLPAPAHTASSNSAPRKAPVPEPAPVAPQPRLLKWTASVGDRLRSARWRSIKMERPSFQGVASSRRSLRSWYSSKYRRDQEDVDAANQGALAVHLEDPVN